MYFKYVPVEERPPRLRGEAWWYSDDGEVWAPPRDDSMRMRGIGARARLTPAELTAAIVQRRVMCLEYVEQYADGEE